MMATINRRKVIRLLSSAACVLVAMPPNAIAGSPTPDFAPGQEWSIKSASPTTAKVIIGRVGPWRDKVCVNVSIIDIPIPQGMTSAGGVTQIAHIPFDKAALAASVDRLLATGVLPVSSFDSGYKQWQDAKGGIFTVSVEKVIQIMFQTVNQKQG
jgi:hypothetical protein